MLPVVIVAIAVWAFCGVYSSARARFASDDPGAAGMATSTLGGTGSPRFGATTFGQHQRAKFRRWRDRLRKGMTGTAGGHKPSHILADWGAAALAGAALFTAGFASGAAWATTRRATTRGRRARDNSRPVTPPAGSIGPPRGADDAPRRPRADEPRPNAGTQGEDEVVDAELLDDEHALTRPATAPDDVIDAEVIDDAQTGNGPPALDRPTEPALPEGTSMTEILNIHQLFAFARGAADAAAQLVEQAAIRKSAAVARAEAAAAVATAAAARAAQLEAVHARFASLNMDPASLAAIAAAYQTASGLAAAEQRRAEAEMLSAQAAAASAASAEADQVAVMAMHDTVNARQSPHAMAQAETGNAAAHSSVLAAS